MKFSEFRQLISESCFSAADIAVKDHDYLGQLISYIEDKFNDGNYTLEFGKDGDEIQPITSADLDNLKKLKNNLNVENTKKFTFSNGKSLVGDKGVNKQIVSQKSSGKADKAKTWVMTELKENAVKIALQYDLDDPNEIKAILTKESQDKKLKEFIESNDKMIDKYCIGAASSNKSFKNYVAIKSSEYTFERQKEDKSKLIYDIASSLGGKGDNWNPADLWVIKKNVNLKNILSGEGFSLEGIDYLGYTDLSTFNALLFNLIKNKIIIPISLKLPEGDAKVHFYNPSDEVGKIKPVKCVSISVWGDDDDGYIKGIRFNLDKPKANISVRLKAGSIDTPLSFLLEDKDFNRAPESIDKKKMVELIDGLKDESNVAKSFSDSNSGNVKRFNTMAKEFVKAINSARLKIDVMNSFKFYTNSKKIDADTLTSQYTNAKNDDQRKKIARNVYVFTKTLETLNTDIDKIINEMYITGLKLSATSGAYYKIY